MVVHNPPVPIVYRRVLAIDPSVKKTGWALLDANGRRVSRIVDRGVYQTATSLEIATFADAFISPTVRPDIVSIEDQYFAKNVRTLIRLVEMRTRFQFAFEERRLPVVLVPARDWQMGLLRGMINERSLRTDRKKAAMSYVRRFYVPDITQQDEVDAIMIGTWAVRADLVSPLLASK